MSFNQERFKQAMKNSKLTTQKLVDKLYSDFGIEITLDGIKYYTRKGSKSSPSTEKLSAIAKILNVTTDYLLGKDMEVITKVIPLIGKSSCGKPKDYDLNGYEPVPIPADMYRTGMYAIEAEGNSMTPKINEGDIVYCCPNQVVDSGKIVHYWLDGESGIKRYKINETGTIISLIPVNSDHDIITIHCDDNIELRMAKVVGKIDKDF
ncbi:helix-turn-helix domain-containing protein [Poseidonibacter lekithochrous]|uniref:helix-turn-helix domain-containing protein n=1 Tax=Poseidonibacter lekithochrous TaxID=1904463 RepID=UPI000D3632DD|nr:XRE family transcriptional regulator [Poseidonibacter lekithochrous]